MKKLDYLNTYAKLLSKEGIEVIHNPKMTTAAFNTFNRQLMLPVLKDDKHDMYNGFVCHEISHAIWTPPKHTETKEYLEYEKLGYPHSYVNVTEDARIEKLLARKYSGANRIMSAFYNRARDTDFFKLKENPDINAYNLIDKINLYCKQNIYGVNLPLQFSAEEKTLLDKTLKTESFQDAVDVAKEIFEFTKKQKDKEQKETPKDSNNGGDSLSENSKNSSKSKKTDQLNSNSDEQRHSSSESSPAKSEDKNSKESSEDLNSITDKAFYDSYNNLVQISNTMDSYITHKEKDLLNYLRNIVQKDKFVKDIKEASIINSELNELSVLLCNIHKQETKDILNNMIIQFNMHKKAKDYQKNKQSKTGKLNTKKLHNYKICEDIFLRNTIVHNSKNHGFVMFLDCSGSMSPILYNTARSIAVLAEFCNKLNIPFDVYGFFDRDIEVNYNNTRSQGISTNTLSFSFVNFLSNSKKQFKDDLKYFLLWAYLVGDRNHKRFSIPNSIIRYSLSCTPLNSAMLGSVPVVNNFLSNHKTDKTTVLWLTDGRATDELRVGEKGFVGNTGNLKIFYQGALKKINNKSMSDLVDFCENVTGVDYLNFYLTNDIGQNTLTHFDIDKNLLNESQVKFKRKKYVEIKPTKGYSSVFFVDPNNFSEKRAEIDVVDLNSKKRILDKDGYKLEVNKAFKRSLVTGRGKFLFLSEYIKKIA